MTKPSEQLLGQTIGSGWVVKNRVSRYPGQTGSTFSVGYIVEKDGQQAYMKAMDYFDAAFAADIAAKLQQITSIILFERNLLNICLREKLTKVIRLIETGQFTPSGHVGNLMAATEFFIFELAQADIRKTLTYNGFADAAWNLRSLHQIATGLDQLHRHDMAHQDVKPSNVLVMTAAAPSARAAPIKLGDVGRASLRGQTGPFDGLKIAGDHQYAPLEAHYDFTSPEWVDKRDACDCFLLGSMVTFLFAGTGMTQLYLLNLDAAHYPGTWRGTFKAIIPVLLDAQSKALQTLEKTIFPPIREELLAMVRELTHPDPEKRGDPRARAQTGRPVGMDRYVSRFNALATRAELELRMNTP
jgi:serine/threonine protein kinase